MVFFFRFYQVNKILFLLYLTKFPFIASSNDFPTIVIRLVLTINGVIVGVVITYDLIAYDLLKTKLTESGTEAEE